MEHAAAILRRWPRGARTLVMSPRRHTNGAVTKTRLSLATIHTHEHAQSRLRDVRHDAVVKDLSTLNELKSHVACEGESWLCAVAGGCEWGTRLRLRRGVECVEGAGERRRADGGSGVTAGSTPHRVRLRILKR